MANDKILSRPLFVDLDGSLVSTDTLWESCLLFIKRYPFLLWRLIIWSFYGRAYFKEQVAKKVIPNAEILPYREEVVEYISNAKDSGRDVYLITAANQRIADSISKHIKYFTSIIGSSSKLNLKGESVTIMDKIIIENPTATTTVIEIQLSNYSFNQVLDVRISYYSRLILGLILIVTVGTCLFLFAIDYWELFLSCIVEQTPAVEIG